MASCRGRVSAIHCSKWAEGGYKVNVVLWDVFGIWAIGPVCRCRTWQSPPHPAGLLKIGLSVTAQRGIDSAIDHLHFFINVLGDLFNVNLVQDQHCPELEDEEACSILLPMLRWTLYYERLVWNLSNTQLYTSKVIYALSSNQAENQLPVHYYLEIWEILVAERCGLELRTLVDRCRTKNISTSTCHMNISYTVVCSILLAFHYNEFIQCMDVEQKVLHENHISAGDFSYMVVCGYMRE